MTRIIAFSHVKCINVTVICQPCFEAFLLAALLQVLSQALLFGLLALFLSSISPTRRPSSL